MVLVDTLGNVKYPCERVYLLESIDVIPITSVSYGFTKYAFAPSIASL